MLRSSHLAFNLSFIVTFNIIIKLNKAKWELQSSNLLCYALIRQKQQIWMRNFLKDKIIKFVYHSLGLHRFILIIVIFIYVLKKKKNQNQNY